MAKNQVLHAYSALAPNVVAMLGTDIAHTDPDRAIIEAWAQSVTGRILDVGSGTGRWSGHLANLGFDVEGLEPVPELIEIARAAHPSVPFRRQTITDLANDFKSDPTRPNNQASAPEQWAGVLAWYSLIHMNPSEFAAALKAIHHVLTPGGTLLLSYFSGETLEVFQHPIAPAYRWPAQAVGEVTTAAGLEVVTQQTDAHHPHAFMLARKPAT